MVLGFLHPKSPNSSDNIAATVRAGARRVTFDDNHQGEVAASAFSIHTGKGEIPVNLLARVARVAHCAVFLGYRRVDRLNEQPIPPFGRLFDR